LARKHNFTQRQSKLSAYEFIDTLMFSQADHSQVSLQDCCNDLIQQHQKQYSKVAFHKRFNQNSVNFLKAVLADQLADHPTSVHEDLWNPFNRILIGDSCKFSIPEHLIQDYPSFQGCRPTKALMNLQYAFDLKNGNWQYLEFTRAVQNDQRYSANILDDIQANDLLLRDLGFVTQRYLQTVVEKKAYFINRMPAQLSVFQHKTKEPINWKSLYRRIKKYDLNYLEVKVTIGKENNGPIQSRLVISVVPLKIYQERVRKAEKHARSKGFQVSEEHKIRCRVNVFITNIPKELLAPHLISKVYRTRWQIELVFKTWKSLLLIHKTKPVKKHRLECQLLAKFIWVLLNWKIFQAISKFILKESPHNNCSLWKFFKQSKHHSSSLRMVIARTLQFEQWCKIYIYPIIQGLLIEPKNGKSPHHQILNESFSLG
jgi:hypothetical protein